MSYAYLFKCAALRTSNKRTMHSRLPITQTMPRVLCSDSYSHSDSDSYELRVYCSCDVRWYGRGQSAVCRDGAEPETAGRQSHLNPTPTLQR